MDAITVEMTEQQASAVLTLIDELLEKPHGAFHLVDPCTELRNAIVAARQERNYRQAEASCAAEMVRRIGPVPVEDILRGARVKIGNTQVRM